MTTVATTMWVATATMSSTTPNAMPTADDGDGNKDDPDRDIEDKDTDDDGVDDPGDD